MITEKASCSTSQSLSSLPVSNIGENNEISEKGKRSVVYKALLGSAE